LLGKKKAVATEIKCRPENGGDQWRRKSISISVVEFRF
jgi:hypothetical protein